MAERDFASPPPAKEVPRHLLWRSLLRRPRPRKLLEYRHPAAPTVKLYVVALRGLEDAAIFGDSDGEADFVEKQLRSSRVIAELVCQTLWTPTQRAFDTSEVVMRMPTSEVTRLGNAVFEALAEISPVYWRCNSDAWTEALKEGAQHPTNRNEAALMYHCCDHGMTSLPMKRPTRYFGLPGIELTDGQQMAFSAAVDWVREASGTAA